MKTVPCLSNQQSSSSSSWPSYRSWIHDHLLPFACFAPFLVPSLLSQPVLFAWRNITWNERGVMLIKTIAMMMMMRRGKDQMSACRLYFLFLNCVITSLCVYVVSFSIPSGVKPSSFHQVPITDAHNSYDTFKGAIDRKDASSLSSM